ncbi:type IV secretory system conjugative DNA transfer family protein [Arthrobacter sp. MI7-26]|uniref:type IV secretory system conjugative DNA transfer family protein n=1 Tax=Arthrobacter sp. MI7-26 TaxID=2993653 RepID=UPI002248E9A8|nr:type IV secretory system conjugative DNA transfer family protein [Arthrobacter sp. MI7-26]MCX2746249.1 type IV secretory system conjugative DNA transfer family protein [Arthrobacter sp. MI7-26]
MSDHEDSSLVWREVHWPRPLTAGSVRALVRHIASNRLPGSLIWEIRGHHGMVQYFVATNKEPSRRFGHLLRQLLPGITLTTPDSRQAVTKAALLRLEPPSLATNVDDPEAISRSLLTALSAARFADDLLVLQLVLGEGRSPRFAANTTNPTTSWWQAVSAGTTPAPTSVRSSVASKAAQHSVRAIVRIGVAAESSAKRQALALGVLEAVGTMEGPGIRASLAVESAVKLNEARLPKLRWSLRLSIDELAALLAPPLGVSGLPGLPQMHPKLLQASPDVDSTERVFAFSNAPGKPRHLGISPKDSLRHAVFVGPTGSGKSTALLNTIVADMFAGRSICVIDPKRDLIDDVLARVPESRQGDVVVLDASDEHPVGFNPLASTGRNAEVVVDGILAAIKDIFDGIGPRSQDILHASLITLVRAGGRTLADIPQLLSDAAYRRPLSAAQAGDPVLAGFWAWYDGLKPEAQASTTAPLLNKLRVFLLRPQLRRVLNQPDPAFSVNDLFTKSRILLVPLNKGVVGVESASLLGSLLAAELWQCIQARAAVPVAARHPLVITVDEVQDYLKIDLADALAQSRSLGVGWQLAHQFRKQLPAPMAAAIDNNARSKIAFALEIDDAKAMASMAPGLEPIDFQSLGKYEIYCNLVAGGQPSGWASGKTLPPPIKISDPETLRKSSRKRYGPAEEVKPPPAAPPPANPSTQTPAVPAVGRKRRNEP